MFATILHANDGSEQAFKALLLAIDLAEQNKSSLHMVLVEEVPAMPDSIEEIRETTATAGRRYHQVIQRARAVAEQHQLTIQPHVLAGHPVRKIIEVSHQLSADLLVIGATGHSAFYERMVGSRADRIVQLARCPVLVVK
jgi:nucleotide-binding universal stress UspA family protein